MGGGNEWEFHNGKRYRARWRTVIVQRRYHEKHMARMQHLQRELQETVDAKDLHLTLAETDVMRFAVLQL